MASNYTEDELYLIASLPHTIGASDGFCWSQWAFWHREGNVRECDIDPQRREGVSQQCVDPSDLAEPTGGPPGSDGQDEKIQGLDHGTHEGEGYQLSRENAGTGA
jgi:hypothetical protein